MPTVQTESSVSNQPEAVLRNKGKQRYQTLKKQPPSGKKIWSEEVSHNEKASWLEDVELEFSTTEEQADINITAGILEVE